MSRAVKIYLGNFTDKDVLVEIGSDIYDVRASDCPYILRESQNEPVMVKIGFKSDKRKASDKKEFSFEIDGVIRFCKSDEEVRFCEIERLEPTTTLRFID